MAQLPTGTIFSFATAFSAAKTITNISNAAEAVVSSVAHGFEVGDILLISSGWGRLHRRAYRIKSVTTDSYVLEDCNTTNVKFYIPGGGGGSAVKATTWVQLAQVMNPTSSGGEPKKVEYKYVESDVTYQINDGFSPISRKLDMDADAIGTPGYVALQALTETQADTIMMATTKNGAFTILGCTVALNEEVLMQEGQINKVSVDISGNGRSTRYAS